MADRTPPPGTMSRDHWAAQIAALDDAPTPSAPPARKPPITADRIVRTAFEIIESEGFEALTMRRVATLLDTGPASLYAHVRNKAELDDLLIGDLCSRVSLPVPQAAYWRSQITDVCRQLRDLYLRYPGIARASLAASPNSLDTIRVSEGMLAILVTGGIPPQSAAWAIDAAFLYVSAYCFEVSLRWQPDEAIDGRVLERAEVVERFRMLPADRFPNTIAYANELSAGEGHDRFDFTLDLLFRGLRPAA